MSVLLHPLDAIAARGDRVTLWWRDDDAVAPTAALDRLLAVADRWDVPLTLAVIPQPTGPELAARLDAAPGVTVALHGWAHADHSGGQGKKQELGPHRPAALVLDELARGLAKLRALHGARLSPVLVPPWNRIAPGLLPGLPGLGIAALSVFGLETPAPLPVINTHVDVMDWRGTRGGRPTDAVLADLARAIAQAPDRPIGLLTHHLVHDAQVWDALEALFALTRDHPACRWTDLSALLPRNLSQE
jgi:peptidoglycan/xylan/chitin deacetylase (PgdA/CDA1 family)